jgi:hypothetical protein
MGDEGVAGGEKSLPITAYARVSSSAWAISTTDDKMRDL